MKQVSNPVPGSAPPGVKDRASASADGRFVAYVGLHDQTSPTTPAGVYVYDGLNDTRELVSVASDGTPANDISGNPAISADGRYVAFESDADNLVPNDTNDVTDVFVHDRVTGTTERVSVDSDGNEVSDPSYEPSISANGNRVEFTSDSDDLDPVHDSNGWQDIYVHDRTTGATLLASTKPLLQTDFGAWNGAISGDGNSVVFTTDTPLATADINDDDDVYVRSLVDNSVKWVSKPIFSVPDGGTGDYGAISSDGRFIAFESTSTDLDTMTDTNIASDVFVRDMVTNTTSRVSVTPAGGILTGSSSQAAISADGSRIAFVSTGNASGTDANGTIADVFVRDRTFNRTLLTSSTPLLDQLPYQTLGPSLSPNGRYVFFSSEAPFVASSDSNGLSDIYLRAIDVPVITSVSPTTVARGTNVTLTINGSSFLPGANVLLPDGMTATSVTVNSDSKITVQATVGASTATGPATFYVQNPGGGPGIFSGAIGRSIGGFSVT